MKLPNGGNKSYTIQPDALFGIDFCKKHTDKVFTSMKVDAC